MHEAQTQRSSQLRSEDVVLGTQRELLAQEEGRRGRRRVYLAKVESAYGAASTSGARGGVADMAPLYAIVRCRWNCHLGAA